MLQSEHPTAPRSPQSCPTCGGKGEFYWWYEGVPSSYQCPCVDQIILSRYLLWCGIGIAQQRLGFSDLSQMDPNALAAAAEWSSNMESAMRAGHGLLFHGPPGTGKSALSILLLKSAIGQGTLGFFSTFDRIIEMLLSKWRQDADAAAYHSRCRNTPLLVIDDVGREMKQRRFVVTESYTGMRDTNPASAEFALESIIRYRIGMALPTILTTNLNPADLATHYGPNFASLLTEATIQVPVTGSDWRDKAFQRAQVEAGMGMSRPVVIG